MEEYLATIKLFAGDYVPENYALCDGSLLNIVSNEFLYSVIGTTYGGDGEHTFALPNLCGRIAVAANYAMPVSSVGGLKEQTLSLLNLPRHTHETHFAVNSQKSTSSVPAAGQSIAAPGKMRDTEFVGTLGFNTETPDVKLNSKSVVVGFAGSSVPINQMQPYLCLNYIICINGVYPRRDD